MSVEKRDIKNSKEALQGFFALAIQIAQIKKEGVAGLPKLIGLFDSLKAGIEGGDQIPLELKDLDLQEFNELAKVGLIGTGEVLREFGAANANKYVALATKSLDAGNKIIAIVEPLVGEFKSIRSDVQ
jgi:hypothetical protein